MNDVTFDYQAGQRQDAEAKAEKQSLGKKRLADLPSFDGGGGSPYSGPNSFYAMDTNALWLEITNVTSELAYLNLHNATNKVYAVWSVTNLPGGWRVEREVWPTNSSVMPFTVPVLNRTNLFMRARDWTGIDSNNDGVPDWWVWKYFGTLSLNATNLDSGGINTLGYDYTNHLDPNVITFTIAVTNNYVSTSYPGVQLDVSNGAPGYYAVLVDNTNFSTATWQPYTGNPTVNLGTTAGWHEVWIGLRGLPSDAHPTWKWCRLKLDTIPPQVVITGPTNSTVMLPVIQLQGYSPEALQSISYDLTNAAGLLTNQQVLVLDQFYDTNTWEFTTNTFQGFDIPLTNGVNTITLHAMDLAGNVTTTNFSYTLDCSSKTNPPVVQINWPQAGMAVSGSNFTLLGHVDDPTATVLASIISTNGNTNLLSGFMERDGRFWVDNMPLNSGSNHVSIIVSNVAGLASMTNFDVTQSAIGLTIDLLADASQLWQPTVNLTGRVSDSTATVTVNGVTATNNGDGTWSVSGVPTSPGGVAVFKAMATTSGGTAANALTGPDKPARLYMVSDTQVVDSYRDSLYTNVIEQSAEVQDWFHYDHRWQTDVGGQGSRQQKQRQDVWPDVGWNYITSNSSKMTWMADGAGIEIDTAGDGTLSTNTIGLPLICNEHCVVNDPQDPPTIISSYGDLSDDDITHWKLHETYTRKAQTKWRLETGGRAGRKNLWRISGSATEILDKRATACTGAASSTNLLPQRISINGHKLNADGSYWVLLPDGTNYDVTPLVAGVDFYKFTVSTQKVTLQSLTVTSNSAVHVGSANDWAAVKTPTNDWVYVQAVLSTSDTNAANQIQWSGGQAVSGNPFQRRVTKTNSVETTVTATLGFANLSLNVWIVWSSVTRFNNTGPADIDSLVEPAAFGISDTTHNGTLMRVTITPPGFGAFQGVNYDIKRTRESNAWVKDTGVWSQDPLIDYSPLGTDDDLGNSDEDLTPSYDDHIYVEDFPGITVTRAYADEAVQKGSFNEWNTINLGGWKKCSDDYPWHSIVWLMRPNSGTDWIRKSSSPNEIQPGAITVGTANTP